MTLRRLPIFPLPLVLFPGTPQLLHIFEPRYRQMLADCETGERVFGISFAKAEGDPDPAPGLGEVGCTAHLRAVRYLPDGRANIMTLGGERYVLRSYVQTDRLYRVALVEPFGDDAVEQNGLEALAAAVRREFVQLAEALAALQDAIAPPVELPRNPAEVSFHVAAALDIPVATKQRLLELRSPAVRLRYLREILHRLNQDVTSRVGVHLLVKRNGKAGSVAVDR